MMSTSECAQFIDSAGQHLASILREEPVGTPANWHAHEAMHLLALALKELE